VQTNFRIDQPVLPSIQWLIASADKTMVRWASMKSRLPWWIGLWALSPWADVVGGVSAKRFRDLAHLDDIIGYLGERGWSVCLCGCP
jgi:hypothetical protein